MGIVGKKILIIGHCLQAAALFEKKLRDAKIIDEKDIVEIHEKEYRSTESLVLDNTDATQVYLVGPESALIPERSTVKVIGEPAHPADAIKPFRKWK